MVQKEMSTLIAKIPTCCDNAFIPKFLVSLYVGCCLTNLRNILFETRSEIINKKEKLDK